MQKLSNDILFNKTSGNITTFIIINGKRNAAEISNFTFDKDDKVYYFNRLIVHNSLRNKGIATALMTKLISILDEEKIILHCDVNPYGELNMEQLISFYGKFGFIKDIYFNVSEKLIRYPIK